MHYASLGGDGWYIHREDGSDTYTTPLSGPHTKEEAERIVRELQPEMWKDIVHVGANYIGPG